VIDLEAIRARNAAAKLRDGVAGFDYETDYEPMVADIDALLAEVALLQHRESALAHERVIRLLSRPAFDLKAIRIVIEEADANNPAFSAANEATIHAAGYWRLVAAGSRLLAEVERLTVEGKRDYDGMREFQGKFIAADQERVELKRQLADASAEVEWYRKCRREVVKAVIEEAEVAVGALWIAVQREGDSDRHPEVDKDTEFIVTVNGHVTAAWYNPSYRMWYCELGQYDRTKASERITHFRPMPGLPPDRIP
jgi:hypothetical protein